MVKKVSSVQEQLVLPHDEIVRLLSGYHARVPRYTSYPTAVEFKKGYQPASWQAALAHDITQRNKDTALYVHIPFCPVMCFFCACSKEVTKDKSVVRPFLDALRKELSWYKQYSQDLHIVQLHWGGGSPNFLSPSEMNELYQMLRDAFPSWSAHAEQSVELDPRETSKDHIDVLIGHGFSRFSFGVQDFNEEVQRIVHRKQSKEQTLQLVEYCRTRGASGVNFDLIYGLPSQTRERWQETIREVIAMKPDRLALYGYAHVEWKSVAQKTFDKKAQLPNAEERVDLFVDSYTALTSADYYYIGMDHFSLAGDALTRAHQQGTMRRNFMGYTTGADTRVLGFGPSAISSLSDAYAQNAIAVSDYQELINEVGSAINRGVALTHEDKEQRYIIESIMCTGKIDKLQYRTRWNKDFDQAYSHQQSKLAELARDGIITLSAEAISVTLLGRVFLRSVAAVFDQYLHVHQASSQKVFSQAI